MLDALDLLDGTSVVDLGMWRPAPFGTQLLAELGATVVKIERPGGDPMRAFPALYTSLNARKRILELDLKDTADRGTALEIAAEADVVVEGFRPGVAARLGVGYADIAERNPRVVYCSVSGFGQTGPLADAPGHDVNYQALSGVLAARFPEISRTGIPVADLAGGAYAALSICAALRACDRDGRGRHIDVSMTDVLSSWAGPQAGTATGEVTATNYPAYGAFQCADGYVTLGVVTEDHFWRGLCNALDLGDLGTLDADARARDSESLRARIAGTVAARGRDELVAELVDAGVPVAPLLAGDEFVRSEHARARGLTRAEADGSVHVGHPIRYD